MPLIRLVDIIPKNDSDETAQNSEPSLAVNPLDPTQMIAGVFGDPTNPYFKTTDGGATWLDYGGLNHTDKSLAWLQDGSAALTATLFDTSSTTAEINIYSGTIAGSGYTQAVTGVTYNPGLDLDQPWIRTGPSGHVYLTYNNDSASDGKTASILVSTDGGLNYTSQTLDRVGGAAGFDAATVRTAVNGNTVYALFTRFNSVVESNSDGTRYDADVVVVRSDDGGLDGFKAFGPDDGVHVAEPTSVEAPQTEFTQTALTLGRERIGGDGAIAVDPNNPMHVVVAYGNSPASGEVQLVVKESTDGGMSWTEKFETPAVAGGRSALPALSILQNGTIGLLYARFDQTTDPSNGQLSQHLLTTTNDFVGITDTILATENNNAAPYDIDPYIGDFFDLTAVGNTFYGIFSASNDDNGAATGAQFANVSFQRDFTGTLGTSSFQLTDSSGHPVGSSIDPFVFSYQLDLAPVTGSIGIAAVGDFTSSGNHDFVWPDSSASFSMFEYDPTAQNVTDTGLGTVGPGWSILGSAHFSDASTSQMLTDYMPNGTMTLWWVSNGALTGVDLGQRWQNVGFITNGRFTDNGGVNISNFLVTNLTDQHLYDWWIDAHNTLQGIDLGAYWSNVALVAAGQFTSNGGTNLLVNNALDNHLYDWWIDSNNTLQGIDLGAHWSNVAAVATGQFTANGGTNLLVNNTLDNHLYDWWIDGSSNTLQGIDLGAYWTNVQIVTTGRFDNNSSNTEMLVQNTVDRHLYEWWITSQGQLAGIDLGAYWTNVQLTGTGHFNNSSADDQLLVRNTSDGHFYEWWIDNDQLQGLDLGVSVSTGVSGSSATAASASTSGAVSSGNTISSDGTMDSFAMPSASSVTLDSTSMVVQAMASFGSNGAVANSNSALPGPDPSQQSALVPPIDGHLAHV